MRPLCDPDIKGFAINVKKKITTPLDTNTLERAKPFFNRIVLRLMRPFLPSHRLLLALACLLALLCSCRAKRAPAPAANIKLGYRETGVASWYGHPYHGRATASGEIYDMNQLTAAHRRLPFGITARVTNLANSKTVDVRINDRGPFVKGRILDLSRAAADRLDLVRAGIGEVRLEVIRVAPALRYSWQTGAFRERMRADDLVTRLRQNGCPLSRVVASNDSKGVSLYKVLVGEAERAADLEPYRRCLRPDAADARIIRVDD